jgi:hypothetical protein
MLDPLTVQDCCPTLFRPAELFIQSLSVELSSSKITPLEDLVQRICMDGVIAILKGE